MEFISIKQLQKLAQSISSKVRIGDSIYLQGDIGVGKTTFSRFFIHSIQKKNKVKKEEVLSPTFNIVQYYYINKNLQLAHYDFYRIKKSKDLINTGIFDQENLFCNIIEWPELIKKKNSNRIEIKLQYTKNEELRKCYVEYFGRFKK